MITSLSDWCLPSPAISNIAPTTAIHILNRLCPGGPVLRKFHLAPFESSRASRPPCRPSAHATTSTTLDYRTKQFTVPDLTTCTHLTQINVQLVCTRLYQANYFGRGKHEQITIEMHFLQIILLPCFDGTCTIFT